MINEEAKHKLYASQMMLLEDPKLVETYKSFEANKLLADMPQFKIELSEFYNSIRRMLDIESLMSMQVVRINAEDKKMDIDINGTHLLVAVYDIMPVSGVTLVTGVDEQGMYVLI